MLEETSGMKPGNTWHGPWSTQVMTCYDPAAYSCQHLPGNSPHLFISLESASAPPRMLEPKRTGDEEYLIFLKDTHLFRLYLVSIAACEIFSCSMQTLSFGMWDLVP